MRWPVRLYRVEGDSMLPTYAPGQTLLGSTWFVPDTGQVVVADHFGRPLIKRIKQIKRGKVWLEGDNLAHSTDSRHFGPLPIGSLQARIILRLG